jgi:DNA-binding NarL/FixJ family response regulator
MNPIRVLIADDHDLVRQGFCSLLEHETGIEVVANCGDGREVLQAVEAHHPDVLLCDLKMPGLNGLEVARQVSEHNKTRVLMLSVHADEVFVRKSLSNGAAGYLLKDASRDELVKAIREVAAGHHYLSAPLTARAIEAYAGNGPPNDTFMGYDALTDREREILQLAAEGYGNKEIGERLFISPRTVETHRANFMRKLNVENQAELIRYALQRGILPDDR